MSAVLDPFNAVVVEQLEHFLLLGLELRDAGTGGTALPPVVATLESLGHYDLGIVLDAHGASRHALRYAGLVRARLRALVKAAADTSAVVLVDSPARQHVPRRLKFTLALDGDAPKLIPPRSNVRTAWLWPGAAYAMPPTATLLRGRVAAGLDLAHAVPVPWARVFATTPMAETVFANAIVAGSAHADDRGEYVLAITQDAFAGASLPPTADVRLWAFRSSFVGPPDPAVAYDGLGAEDAGADAFNDVLRGDVVPAGYTLSVNQELTLVRAAQARSGDDTALLFT
jgi:hypothetical protein